MHLLDGELIAGFVLIRWITDEASETADEEGDIVAEFLELAQLTHGDGVTKMQVGCTRVISTIDAEDATSFFGFSEAGVKLFTHGFFGLRVTIFRAGHEDIDLLINGGHKNF